MKNDYVLGNQPEEIERLKIQASFFEPMAKEVLMKAGIKKGMRCVDVGCGSGDVTRMMGSIVGKKGIVIGIDMNQKYIQYCTKVNKQSNVAFVCDDIIGTKLIKKEDFDIIYSRFMFVHLKDKLSALKSMIRLAKKDGVIVIQETDHSPGSWLSYPKRESVEQLRKIYVRLIKKMGGDPLAGRKLYRMFVKESMRTTVECYSPCLLMGHKPYSDLGWRLAESLKPQIISFGLLSQTEYRKLLDELREMSNDTESFATYARFFSVSGRKH